MYIIEGKNDVVTELKSNFESYLLIIKNVYNENYYAITFPENSIYLNRYNHFKWQVDNQPLELGYVRLNIPAGQYHYWIYENPFDNAHWGTDIVSPELDDINIAIVLQKTEQLEQYLTVLEQGMLNCDVTTKTANLDMDITPDIDVIDNDLSDDDSLYL